MDEDIPREWVEDEIRFGGNKLCLLQPVETVSHSIQCNDAAAPLLVHGKYDLTVSSSQIESRILCAGKKVDKNLFSFKKVSLLDTKISNVFCYCII